jgi:hypothetical protein
MGRKIKAMDALPGKLVEVDADAIQLGLIRQQALPEPLLRRIRAIHEVISDVYPGSLEQMEINFMRDAHPEHEVAVWERIAAGLQKVIRQLPSLEGKAVLRTLLAHSMNALSPAEQAKPDVRKIIEIAEWE